MARWSLRLFVLVSLAGSILSLTPSDTKDEAPHPPIERPASDEVPEDGAYDNTRIRCRSDVSCGKGECWEGRCLPSGYCMAYYNCV